MSINRLPGGMGASTQGKGMVPMTEPRIVESGPIHITMTVEEALQLFVKEWVLKRLQEQTAAPEVKENESG